MSHSRSHRPPESTRTIELTWGPNQQLITRLAAESARVLLIGGTAIGFHAPERREPNDLDLLIEPTEETASKVLRAVDAVIGRTLPILPAQLARAGAGFPEKAILNVDILTPYIGFDFADAWTHAEQATMAYSSTVVRVASIPILLGGCATLSRPSRSEPRALRATSRSSNERSPGPHRHEVAAVRVQGRGDALSRVHSR